MIAEKWRLGCRATFLYSFVVINRLSFYFLYKMHRNIYNALADPYVEPKLHIFFYKQLALSIPQFPLCVIFFVFFGFLFFSFPSFQMVM